MFSADRTVLPLLTWTANCILGYTAAGYQFAVEQRNSSIAATEPAISHVPEGTFILVAPAPKGELVSLTCGNPQYANGGEHCCGAVQRTDLLTSPGKVGVEYGGLVRTIALLDMASAGSAIVISVVNTVKRWLI